MTRKPSISGEYLADPEDILRRALEAVGAPAAAALVEEARARTGVGALSREAPLLWAFCETELVPLVADRHGAHLAERLEAHLHGAMLALDSIQTGRLPDVPKRRRR